MELQLALLRSIQTIHSPLLSAFFTAVTITAEEYFFIIVAAWILWCRDKEIGYRIGFAFLSGAVLNPILKNLFQVIRPIGREGIESMRIHTATGYAFPSGHTQGAASFWTGVMTTLRRRWAWILGSVMMLLVAFSRLYLGVHWPADVVGGLAVGILWVVAVNRLYDRARNSRQPALLLVCIVPLMGGLLFIPRDHSYIVAAGALLGFWSGYVLETRYIHHLPAAARAHLHAVKLLCGLAVVLLLQTGLKALLPFPPAVSDLLRYFLIGLWLTAGAPFVFSLFKRRLPGTATPQCRGPE